MPKEGAPMNEHYAAFAAAAVSIVLAATGAVDPQANADRAWIIEADDGVFQTHCPFGEWPVSTETPLPADDIVVAPPALKCVPISTTMGAWVGEGPYDPNYCPELYQPSTIYSGGERQSCRLTAYVVAQEEQEDRRLAELSTE